MPSSSKPGAIERRLANLKPRQKKAGLALRGVSIRITDPVALAKLTKYLEEYDGERPDAYGALIEKAVQDLEF